MIKGKSRNGRVLSTKASPATGQRKLARDYNRELQKITDDVFREAQKELRGLKGEPSRQDARKIVRNMKAFKKAKEASQAAAKRFASNVGKQGTREAQRQLKKLGQPFDGSSIKQAIDGVEKQNLKMVDSILRDMRDRISESIARRPGKPSRTKAKVRKELSRSRGIVKRRAKNISMDQAFRGTGSVTEFAVKESGIKRYIWVTREDGRVRPTHRANSRKVFSYDKHPSATGAPGNDPNCRCIAVPVPKS